MNVEVPSGASICSGLLPATNHTGRTSHLRQHLADFVKTRHMPPIPPDRQSGPPP